MRVAVVGPGSMGMLFAAFLARVCDVVLVDHREERAKLLSEKGFRITGETEGHFKLPVTIRPEGGFDAIVVAVKAYSTEEIAQKLPYWVSDAAVLTIQNGMGNAERLSDAVGKNRLVVGVTSHGANRDDNNPFLLHHAGCGETVLGALTPEGKEALRLFLTLFRRAGIEVSITDDIKAVLWKKLLVNAAINPVCALLGIKNGLLPHIEPAWRLACNLVREGDSVATLLGVATPDNIFEHILDVCRRTAENRCSTLQDLLKHRPTEIPFINGYIAEEAERLGIAAPYNRAISFLFESLNTLYRPGMQTDGNS